MQFTLFMSVSLLLLCSLWGVESRQYTSVLEVHGMPWGIWGHKEFCPRGYAMGFRLKVQPYQGFWHDDTAVNGVMLHCSDGKWIGSVAAADGEWNRELRCKPNHYLIQFSLEVTRYLRFSDDTAVDNVRFKCSDNSILEQRVMPWNSEIVWSERCASGAICGIRTRVDGGVLWLWTDNTGLNDLIAICCTN